MKASRLIRLRDAILLRCADRLSRIVGLFGIKRHPHPVVSVRLAGHPYPVYVRLASTDALVLEQIFLIREFSALDHINPPKTMIDCGGNIGLATLYFLNRYPDLQAIVVEPDPDNFHLCRRNLAPYADRVRIVNKGVWNRSTGLVLTGSGWATEVREANPGETPLVEAIDMQSLMEMVPGRDVDLLKVDIERSERVVFGEGAEAWLPRVRNLAIELHDEQCEVVVNRALRPYQYTPAKSGDLTMCLDLHRPVA